MKLLLDTHIALWLASDLSLLSAAEISAVLDPNVAIAVSAVSIWEIQIKWNSRFRSGQRKGPVDPTDLLAALRQMNFDVLPLTPEQAAAGLRQAPQHGDPFDHLLLTIAQETGRLLLTRDAELRGHPLAFHAD